MVDVNNRPRQLLSLSESLGVQRAVRDWVAGCPDLPVTIGAVTFENLPENGAGLCVSTVQAPAYAARYILGGYRAEYRFRLILRVLPSDDDDMLGAVEDLGRVAAWCETATPPDLDGAVNEKIERTSDVAVLAVYEDGSNDYGVTFTLSWEVFKHG